MVSLSPEMSDTYTLGADVMYYPNLELSEEETPRYGKYGRTRHTYLRSIQKPSYNRCQRSDDITESVIDEIHII